jgi:thiamine-phosphate pyrophosphorylase
MMHLPRILYITHPNEDFEDLSWVHRLNEAGVKWIQLRIKQDDFELQYPDKHYLVNFIEIADRLRAITNSLDMLLSINDFPSISNLALADGVHIGKEDQSAEKVREEIGENSVLGVTANSLEEILEYPVQMIDYVGVGPFKFTGTKRKLKPVIGEEGYKYILSELKANHIDIPVYAIGGIGMDDIKTILMTGVHGLALSSLIFDAGHDINQIRKIVAIVQEKEKDFLV